MVKFRRPRRKSSSAALYIAISAFLVILLTLFGLSFFTRANEIEVRGAIKYTEAEIIEASGVSLGDNLLFFDAVTAEENIQRYLPHISEVDVVPIFPSKISIRVVESSPMATLQYREGILVIDSSARVVEILSPEEVAPWGLIEVRGFTPAGADLGARLRAEMLNESQLRYLIEMLSIIEKEGMFNDITFLDVSNIANITFDFLGRYRIILDSPRSIESNMLTLPETIARAEREGVIPPGSRGTIRVSDARGEFLFTAEN